MDYGNGSGPVYTSSQALQICYYIPEDVHDPVSMTGSNSGGNGQTTSGGGNQSGSGTTISASHRSVGECLGQAAIAAGEDLIGLSHHCPRLLIAVFPMLEFS